MFKLFAIVLLSWAAAVQASDLPSMVAATLESPREHTVCFQDGPEQLIIMGGNDELNLHHEVFRFNASKMGYVENVGQFSTGISKGSMGFDGKGNFFYLGGDKGENKSSEFVWQLTSAFPRPLNVGQLPDPARHSCSASDGNGNVYVIGGAEGNLAIRNNIVKYDTVSNTASIVAKLPMEIYGASCAWVEGSIYIFGGVKTNFVYSKEIIQFTPETNEFKVVDTTFDNEGLLHASAVTVGRQIYIVGGMTPNGEIHHLTKFDPITETLVKFNLPSHNFMFAGICTVHVPETNRIFVVGGYTFENNRVKILADIFYVQLDWTL